MRASLSLLSKTELFLSYRDKAFVLIMLLSLFCVSIFIEYKQFKKLTEFDDYITTVWVEKQYKKKNYWVLKYQSIEGFGFYTSSRENLKEIEGNYLSIRLFTDKLDFLSYLKGFYVPSQILSRLKGKEFRYTLMHKLKQLHTPGTGPLYNALFFAGSIPPSLRHQLSALGINHLLAISGFHLGVLSLLLFFILKLLYKPLQGRYFPYRNAHRDISIFILTVLFGYLYFLDFVPSLLRAFSMSVFAYFLYDRGMKILSFASLFLVVSFLIALWPKLIFALGFWFSVAGVFYIFLFLHHMKDLKPWQSFILLHFWVYLSMLPVVHYFYGSFSFYQLYSPILTMAFILFYPLALFLHLISLGFLLDPILDYILGLDIPITLIFTNFWMLIIYLFISLLAIFKRFFFYCTGIFSLLLMTYFFYSVTKL